MTKQDIEQLRKYLLIDEKEINRRRQFFGIDDRVAPLTDALAPLFRVNGSILAEDFYDHLLNQTELKPLIDDPVKLERLKLSLQHYFQSMTCGDYGESYVNERLRVGCVHRKVGLEPKWYIGAYRLYLSRLLPAMGRHCGNDINEFERKLDALLSVMFFDMSLTLDAYHGAHLQELDAIKHELENAHAEAQSLVLTHTGIINALPANIAQLDEHATILAVNDSWRKFAEENCHLGGGAAVGLDYLAICRTATGRNADDAHRIADGIESILQRRVTYFSHEYPCHSLLEKRWFRAIVTPVDFGAHKGAVIMHLNTTHRKEHELALWHSANFDFLTNLPNRSLLLDRAQQAILSAQRNGGRLALLFLDLDRFKQINDTLGHAAGDEMLRVMSRRIEACLRQEDTVGRLSGDEFLIILPDLKHGEDAMKVANKLLEETARPIELNGQQTAVSCSIGIALYPENGETADELLRNSDTAMYAAKAAGRHDVRFFSSEKEPSGVPEMPAASGPVHRPLLTD